MLLNVVLRLGCCLLINLFLCSSQSIAAEADAFVNKLRIELLRDVPLKRKKQLICSRGKICATLTRENCQNPVIFSLCYVLCEGTVIGFSKNACMQTYVKHGFDDDEGTFKDGKTPLNVLQEAIESPKKDALMTYVLCEGVCRSVEDRAFYAFIQGDEQHLQKACQKGCSSHMKRQEFEP